MRVRIFVEPQQGATYDDLLGMARVAEECGFDGFFRSDHYLTMGGDGMPGPTDAWVTLAGLARDTTRLRLGTLLTAGTFRLPGPLAIAVAGVDQMSGGRVELGLGAGWYEAEHTAYGIPFPPLGERFERLAEQLEVVTGLWRCQPGSTFCFEGRHYRLAGSPALPKPVQAPHPPVIVGGAGPRRTPALAARFATEYNVAFHSLDDTGAAFERARAACRAAGRDESSLGLSCALVLCCGTDEASFVRRAAAIGRQPEELRANGACGLVPEVTERLDAYRRAGAGTVYLQVLDLADHDHLRLVADEVLPALT